MEGHRSSRRLLAVTLIALGIVLPLLWLPTPVAHAATITVTTLVDEDFINGNCSLREAIIAANTNAAYRGCSAGTSGMDAINFGVTGTILLGSGLPIVAEDLTVNGSAGGITISGGGTVPSGFMTNPNIILNLNNLTMDHGYSGYGGAIYLDNGATLNVTNSTFSNNVVTTDGGAIYGFSPTSTVSITNSTFYSNTSVYIYGSGGAIVTGGLLTVTNTTFYSNSLTGDPCCIGGGAIYVYSGTATIANSTFSGNSSTGAGGVIYTGISNTTNIINSTLAGNKAIYGAIFNNGPLTLTNTIVANSSTRNCSGVINDGGNNLQFGGTVANSCGGTITIADPKLAPLGNYGGPTKTMGLFVGSAAINVGNDTVCAAAPVNNKDQRGFTRPQGAHCDIGAFEGVLYPLFLPLIEK